MLLEILLYTPSPTAPHPHRHRRAHANQSPFRMTVELGTVISRLKYIVYTVIHGVLEIGISCQSTCRFLKHLIK